MLTEARGAARRRGWLAWWAAELRRTRLMHHVLFFRDQPLDIDAHKAFVRRFGTFALDRFVRGPEDHFEIMPVVR